MKFSIKNLFNKKSIKKLEKAAVVGVASLALIIPLGMGSGASVHAAKSYINDPGLDELIYNGLCNDKGQWVGSRHDEWYYDHGLMDCDGVLSGVDDELQNYAAAHHISFMHAYRLFAISVKQSGHDENLSDTQLMYDYEFHHGIYARHGKRNARHHVNKRNRKSRSRKPTKHRNHKSKRNRRKRNQKRSKRTTRKHKAKVQKNRNRKPRKRITYWFKQ